jgi:hypothetical protein
MLLHNIMKYNKEWDIAPYTQGRSDKTAKKARNEILVDEKEKERVGLGL